MKTKTIKCNKCNGYGTIELILTKQGWIEPSCINCLYKPTHEPSITKNRPCTKCKQTNEWKPDKNHNI